MDDAINLCGRLVNIYNGQSSMHKYNGKYFMVFDNQKSMGSVHGLEDLLNEYGTRHVSGVITQYHLIEHGEVMIGESAVQMLAKI